MRGYFSITLQVSPLCALVTIFGVGSREEGFLFGTISKSDLKRVSMEPIF